MAIIKKHICFESKLSLVNSVLIHGLAFWILVLSEYELISTEESVYLEILFDEVTIKSSKEEIESVQKKIKETRSHSINEMPITDTLVNKNYFVEAANDTTSSESEYSSVESSEKEKKNCI